MAWIFALSLAGAACLSAAGGAHCADRSVALSKSYRWKMTSFFPSGHPQNVALHEFIDTLDRRTNGAVKITIYEGTLGAPTDHWDMLKSNAVQVAFLAEGYSAGRMPVASLSNLSFETTDANVLMEVFSAWMRAGYLKELTDSFHVLSYKPTPYQQLFTAKKKVTSLADLRGLKLRALAGLQGQTITALGASGVSMPGGDMYMGLQTGVIDGTITGADNVVDRKLYEPCKFGLYLPIYSGMWVTAMNKETWDGLPKELQTLVDEVAREVAAADFKRQIDVERGRWEAIRKAGVEVYTISTEERARWKRAVSEVDDKYVRDWSAKGFPVKEALEMMRRIANKP